MGRRIDLRGTCNFRDLGGYVAEGGARVRRGVLFRSDHLSSLDRSALGAFRALGIRTVVDLRTAHERAGRPNRLPHDASARSEHVPISIVPELERPWTTLSRARFILSGELARLDAARLCEAYRGLPARAAPALSQIFMWLAADGRSPLLLHCMGGKDRTGFCAAMILTALGVPMETVLEDYCFTNVCAKARVDALLSVVGAVSTVSFGALGVREAELRGFLEARPEYLEAAFAAIREAHGSLDRYLSDAVGLTPAARSALRGALLEG